MRHEKRVYKVYQFNELKPEAKEKAIEQASIDGINTDLNWWEQDENYNEMARDYGLEVKMSEISFDLDRGSYVYFETFNHGREENWKTGIEVADYKKFVKKAGLKWRKSLEQAFTIGHKHYAGSEGKNTIEADSYYGDSNLTDEEIEKLEACLEEFIDEILSQLKKEYNYLTSEEAIIETIEANEYDFLEDGSRFCL